MPSSRQTTARARAPSACRWLAGRCTGRWRPSDDGIDPPLPHKILAQARVILAAKLICARSFPPYIHLPPSSNPHPQAPISNYGKIKGSNGVEEGLGDFSCYRGARAEGHCCAGAGSKARACDDNGGAGREGREDGSTGEERCDGGTGKEGCNTGATVVAGGRPV